MSCTKATVFKWKQNRDTRVKSSGQSRQVNQKTRTKNLRCHRSFFWNITCFHAHFYEEVRIVTILVQFSSVPWPIGVLGYMRDESSSIAPDGEVAQLVRASDHHTANAGSVPWCGKGFSPQSQLSVQTLFQGPYLPPPHPTPPPHVHPPMCNRMH